MTTRTIAWPVSPPSPWAVEMPGAGPSWNLPARPHNCRAISDFPARLDRPRIGGQFAGRSGGRGVSARARLDSDRCEAPSSSELNLRIPGSCRGSHQIALNGPAADRFEIDRLTGRSERPGSQSGSQASDALSSDEDRVSGGSHEPSGNPRDRAMSSSRSVAPVLPLLLQGQERGNAVSLGKIRTSGKMLPRGPESAGKTPLRKPGTRPGRDPGSLQIVALPQQGATEGPVLERK